MKKFLPYLAIIVAILIALGWYLRSHSTESINQREGDMAVKGAVQKIVLDDTQKKHLVLEKKGNEWMVNDKYVAREELIKQILDAVTRVTSLAPVPHAAEENVLRSMMAENVRVEVFTGGAQPEKVYYVGGPDLENRNTYMVLEEDGKMASRPHLMYLPGFNGYLTPRFNTDPEIWRSRIVFNELPADILQLTLEYPAEEENSFRITRVADDSFSVAPLNEKYLIRQSYLQKYIRQYLDFYHPVYMEAFDNENPVKDSVMKTVPYCQFTLKKTDGQVKSVRLFYMPKSKRSKSDYDMTGKEISHDLDHYNAAVNDTDFAIVQYYVFGKLLRKYRDFYFKPES